MKDKLLYILIGIVTGVIATRTFLQLNYFAGIPPSNIPNAQSQQGKTPFNLNDRSGSYILSEQNPGSYILSYTNSQGVRQDIYVEETSAQKFREYFGQNITVKGYMKSVKRQVQCITAPCDPVEMEVFVVTGAQRVK